MWIPYAFYPSIVALIINLFFILYILRIGIKKPGNFSSFLLFLIVFIGILGEVVERISGPPSHDAKTALLGAKIIAVSGVFLPSILIHFGLNFPYRLKISNKVRSLILCFSYLLSFIGFSLVIFNDLLKGIMVKDVTPYPAFGEYIWGMDYGSVYIIYLLWAFVFGIAILAILYIKFKNTKIKIIKNQILLIFSGLIIVFILVTVSILIPALVGFQMYPLTSISLTIFGIFIIYTIARYRLFLVSPVLEEKVAERKYKLEQGTVLTIPRKKGYEIFADQVHGGVPGLIFTIYSPSLLRERYNLIKTPIFRLSTEVGKNTLNPEIPDHREMIPFIISEFLEKSSSGVVYLDSIDSVLGEDFQMFMDIIKDFVKEERKGILLISYAKGND